MSVVTATYRSEFRVLVVEHRNGFAFELDDFGDQFEHAAQAEPELQRRVLARGYRLRRWVSSVEVGEPGWASTRTRKLARFLAVVERDPVCPRTTHGVPCRQPAKHPGDCSTADA